MTFQEVLQRRSQTLHQNPWLRFVRCAADNLHLLHPRRLASLPGTLRAISRPESHRHSGPPDTHYIRPAASGFVTAANDIKPAAVLDAYGRGLILRWICGRATWWAPAQRVGCKPEISVEPERALALLREGAQATIDRDFDKVAAQAARHAIRRCQPFQPGTRALAALAAIHDAGYGHSVEIKDRHGELIGGCYGIATGRVFITQSRFGQSAAAADLALVILNRHLARWEFAYHDLCSDWNALSLGFTSQSHEETQSCLMSYLAGDRRGRWLAIPALCEP